LNLTVTTGWSSVCYADVPIGVWLLDMGFSAGSNNFLIQLGGSSTINYQPYNIQAGPVTTVGNYAIHTSIVVTNTVATRWYLNAYSSSTQTVTQPYITITRIG